MINFLSEYVLVVIMKQLSDLGEREAIRIITRLFSKGNVAVGIGDDCAAFEFGGKYILVSTDMISKKNHISEGMTPFQVGWFIVAINLSDIAAKGGKPIGLVLSFGLPKETSENYLKELTRGADKCATTNGTSIVGGDMKEASEINICGTAIGIVNKEEFMPRKGALSGDIVAVTGSLGEAGAVFYNLKNKISDNQLCNSLFTPVPKLKEGRILAQLKCVTSCMDISDGLSSSLYQLSEVNKVGFEIDKQSMPIASELLALNKENKNMDIYDIAFHFGGDYELLVTIPPKKFVEAKESLRKNGGDLISIGTVTSDKKIILKDKKVKKNLLNKGYEHFKNHIF